MFLPNKVRATVWYLHAYIGCCRDCGWVCYHYSRLWLTTEIMSGTCQLLIGYTQEFKRPIWISNTISPANYNRLSFLGKIQESCVVCANWSLHLIVNPGRQLMWFNRGMLQLQLLYPIEFPSELHAYQECIVSSGSQDTPSTCEHLAFLSDVQYTHP